MGTSVSKKPLASGEKEVSKTKKKHVVKYKTKYDVPPEAWGKSDKNTEKGPIAGESPRHFVTRRTTEIEANDYRFHDTVAALQQQLQKTQERLDELVEQRSGARNSVFLNPAPEADTTQGEGNSKTAHAFPFVMLGDGKVIIKPTNITALAVICDKAPNPAQNPVIFCSYLQKICRYQHLTGADYRFILEQCLKDTPEEEVLQEVKNLDPKFDTPTEGGYAWQDPNHVKKMFEELKMYLSKLHAQTRDITFAATCKQLPNEAASAFYTRFHSAWVEHAGLPTEDKMAILFTSTFLSNMLPQHSQTVRIMFTNISQMTVEAFGKQLREKDAAGIFPLQLIEGPLQTMLSHQGNKQQGGRQRDKGSDRCFFCNKQGHWSRECKKKKNQGRHNQVQYQNGQQGYNYYNNYEQGQNRQGSQQNSQCQ